jgi:hypothetical protein
MAGGTHVFDMIQRLKDNENLRKQNHFKKSKNIYTRTSKSMDLDYKTATKEERQEIKNKVIQEQTRETRKRILILILSIIVTGTMVMLLLKFLKP